MPRDVVCLPSICQFPFQCCLIRFDLGEGIPWRDFVAFLLEPRCNPSLFHFISPNVTSHLEGVTFSIVGESAGISNSVPSVGTERDRTSRSFPSRDVTTPKKTGRPLRKRVVIGGLCVVDEKTRAARIRGKTHELSRHVATRQSTG